jgi:preprotein translocase subunit SecA
MISETIESIVNQGFGSLVRIEEKATLGEITIQLEPLFLRKSEVKLTPEGFEREELQALLEDKARAAYAAKEVELGPIPNNPDRPMMRELERVIMLRVVDEFWMEHIDAMESLRDSVRLRAYSQVNPVDEYKREGFNMFEEMVGGIKEEIVRRIYTVRLRKNETLQRRGVARNINASAQDMNGPAKRQPVKKGPKIRPNDPCPCGKLRPNNLPMKYKNCCGRN